jgi:hypothetical protein
VAEADPNLTWLPQREAVDGAARYRGIRVEHARQRMIRCMKAGCRIRMRGRTSEEALVYATGHGAIDWDSEFEICVEDLTEAGLWPAPGEPERPVLTCAQIAERERAEATTSPPDPATLPDLILRELTAMPDAQFENGCLLQDLVKHLFVAAQLDKAVLPRAELIELIFRVIANASDYRLTGPPLDNPLGPVRMIPLATLPRFRFRKWDHMRVWRIKAEAPDTEAEKDRNEVAPKAAPAGTATTDVPQSTTEPRTDAGDTPEFGRAATSTDAEQLGRPKYSAIDEPKVNRGGRPTDRDLLAEEADWQLRHEPRPPTLRAFALGLRSWLKVHGEHRAKKTGEVMKVETIEGHVRRRWNDTAPTGEKPLKNR